MFPNLKLLFYVCFLYTKYQMIWSGRKERIIGLPEIEYKYCFRRVTFQIFGGTSCAAHANQPHSAEFKLW